MGGEDGGRTGRRKEGQRRANETEMKRPKSAIATDFWGSVHVVRVHVSRTTVAIHPATPPPQSGLNDDKVTKTQAPRLRVHHAPSAIAEQTYTYTTHALTDGRY